MCILLISYLIEDLVEYIDVLICFFYDVKIYDFVLWIVLIVGRIIIICCVFERLKINF